MRKSLSPSERGFNARDWQHLSQVLTQAVEARLFRRIQAVLLVAEGRTFVETAHITGLSRQAVYKLVHRYLQSHQVESLHDRPHPGR
ncbi:MAG TPA: helix-turn-helix domain-containing protein, partial [Gammaproteobacteria bacterium]|nr:helix-turn-helix domain-containing protein [Gammaproteobacteria bacterium]